MISFVTVALTIGEISFSDKLFSYYTVAQSGVEKNVSTETGVDHLPDEDTLVITPRTKRIHHHRHSRVVCLGSEECPVTEQQQPLHDPDVVDMMTLSSEDIRLSGSSSSDNAKECELSDPSYQSKKSAPSTCNVIHELDFNLPTLKYLAKGNYKIAWDITLDEDEHAVMKTVVYSKIKSSSREVARNARDALIMERAGRAPNSYGNNVLPMYQYCGVTNVVPFASRQPLDKYIGKGKLLNATELYHLALQAARGLYQMQAYKDEKATYAHADVKPSQFLLFDPPQGKEEDGLPILQINDFNRGQYIKRSINNHKESCAFQTCGISHKGSTYRSPEEYMECADQTAAIDVFSLGGVFFFILSNGLPPYFHQTSYNRAVRDILHGILPKLPDRDDYKSYLYFTDEEIDFVIKRAKHPLLVALRDVMKRCWSFDPEARPTSLEVLNILLGVIEEHNK